MTNEERKVLVERLRHPYWECAGVYADEAADQIEADGQRIAEADTLLEQAMADIQDQRKRIAELEAALRKCAEPSRYHAPCPSCGPRMAEQGCYIARAALGDKQ